MGGGRRKFAEEGAVEGAQVGCAGAGRGAHGLDCVEGELFNR